MRDQHIKPLSRPVGLHNYLPEKFTFYWDKEPYTLEAGQTLNMFEWLAIHGAMKLAERWFHLNPTNPGSGDPKTRGFYSRHDDDFKAKVREAIIYPKVEASQATSETANAIAAMNEEEEPAKRGPGRPPKKEIELKTADDEIVEGCQECRATGPRHKPTCTKFKTYDKDATQAAKLSQASA